ncbi:MAG: response regulator transcription factor [Gemmatimonadaceae bacterium]
MRRALVLICDDHPLMSQGLRALLRPNLVVVGVVNDGSELLSQIESTKPDIVLLDLSMPNRNGLELIPDIAKTFPGVFILVVTMHVDRTLADLAIQGGAHGFIPKEASAEELNGAIEAVLSGKIVISPRVPKRSFRDGAAVDHPALDRLTPRHLEILRLIGDGKSSAEIAALLSVSPRTVEFHRASIRKQLGITTEWGLMRFAIMMRVSEGDAVGENAGAEIPGDDGTARESGGAARESRETARGRQAPGREGDSAP